VASPRRKKPAPEPAALAPVLDALPIGLYIVDRSLRIVAWNQQREKGPIGKPRRRTIGRPLDRILPTHGFNTLLPVLRDIFASGGSHEETVETPRGLFHIRRLPVREGGRVTHVLSMAEDITERRALEMRLIATDRLAYLGQLVAGVAHEISNPLAGIAGCAEALASIAQRGAASESARAEARQFRELIQGEVARCERIVRQLLSSARPAPSDTADLVAVVGTALRLLERHPGFTKLRVVSRLPPRLPPVEIDSDSLKQVVLALATNAARAMPGAGTLTLRTRREGRALYLDVTDTGPGVPAALRRRIFEPFFTTGLEEGAGLGLAIARSLVRARGGDLVYRPRRGGACFRVVLKIAGGRR